MNVKVSSSPIIVCTILSQHDSFVILSNPCTLYLMKKVELRKTLLQRNENMIYHAFKIARFNFLIMLEKVNNTQVEILQFLAEKEQKINK